MNPAKMQVLKQLEGWEVLFEQGLDLERELEKGLEQGLDLKWALEAAPVLASWQCLKL